MEQKEQKKQCSKDNIKLLKSSLKEKNHDPLIQKANRLKFFWKWFELIIALGISSYITDTWFQGKLLVDIIIYTVMILVLTPFNIYMENLIDRKIH